MDFPFSPDIIRMLERLIVVLGGILAIVLGYRLFSFAHIRQDSEGSFKSKVVEFTFSRVGPGVFFALFGAYVLYTSLDRPISISNPDSAALSVAMLRSSGSVTLMNPDLVKLQALIEKLPDAERAEAKKLLASVRQRPTFFGSLRDFEAIAQDTQRKDSILLDLLRDGKT